MDNIRFALLCALGVLCFMLFQAWQADYAPTPEAASQKQVASADSNAQGGESAAPPAAVAPESGQSRAQPTPTEERSLQHAQSIHVVTDKLDVTIDTHGGDLRQIALLGVPVSAAEPHTPLHLIDDTPPNFFIVQSGLAGDGAPDHTTVYESPEDSYRMASNADVLRVPLTWSDESGHKVTKTYVFHRDSYRIDLEYKIKNDSDAAWDVSQYVRFWRTPYQAATGIPLNRPFLGVGWYEAAADKEDSYHYEKRAEDKLTEDPLSLTQKGGWLAMVQHYFVGAVIPPDGARVRYFARDMTTPAGADGFASGFISASRTVDAQEEIDLQNTMFIGPKNADDMAATATGLDLTVDYGWFTVLAKPLFWVLNKLHTVAGNWGVAILLLTLLIQIVFYKLSEKQYRAMARMRKFAPRMQQLKEQYGDDKQKLQSKMMELYKKEGFNPLAGCWPMLVQMPVFIAMYWVLRGAAELRLAPFLWLQDLTAPDPYYILPVIFGVTMFLQQRMQTNVSMDPMQQRIMQMMPLGMAVFFAFFPAGLVLYYCFRSLLLIGQQWYIYRKLDAEGLGHSASAK